MGKIRDVLSESDYKNYRNIRAVAFFYSIIGGITTLAGIAVCGLSASTPGQKSQMILIGALMLLFGSVALVGGISVLMARKPLAYLAYVMACLYLAAFPLGTILSLVMLLGLGRYLRNMEEYRAGRSGRGFPVTVGGRVM